MLAKAIDDSITNGDPFPSTGLSNDALCLQKNKSSSLPVADETNMKGNALPKLRVRSEWCSFAAFFHNVHLSLPCVFSAKESATLTMPGSTMMAGLIRRV